MARLESDVIETFSERVYKSQTVFGFIGRREDGEAYAPSIIEAAGGLLCELDWLTDLKGMEYDPEKNLEDIKEMKVIYFTYRI